MGNKCTKHVPERFKLSGKKRGGTWRRSLRRSLLSKGSNEDPASPTKSKGNASPVDNTFSDSPVQDNEGKSGQLVRRIYVALYDFDARTSEDLSFKKGDRLEVLESGESKWWLAKEASSGNVGYVPSNYIELADSMKSFDWFFGRLRRMQAERMLLSQGVKGTFLIRESESRKGDYSLSLCDGESIKHYRIRTLDNGGYYISTKVRFADLSELVAHYQKESDGLSTCLLRTCPRTEGPTLDTLASSDPWEIPRDRITLVKVLGRGQFGEVWEGVWNDTVKVAVKMMKPNSMRKEDFLKEAMLMKKLSHPKLVQLYAVCTKKDPIYIITELMQRGSLLKFLQSEEGQRLDLKGLVDIAAQVASGMAYLEVHSFIHRDLAARNVLVKNANEVKIGDFGLSRFVSESHHSIPHDEKDVKFPIKWTAPEAAIEKLFTTKSDVWSFGVLLYEIITYGRIPYAGMTHREVLAALRRGYRMPKPDECPYDLYLIMTRCWHSSPEERPTFETLQWQLEDYFLTEDSNYMDA